MNFIYQNLIKLPCLFILFLMVMTIIGFAKTPYMYVLVMVLWIYLIENVDFG